MFCIYVSRDRAFSVEPSIGPPPPVVRIMRDVYYRYTILSRLEWLLLLAAVTVNKNVLKSQIDAPRATKK